MSDDAFGAKQPLMKRIDASPTQKELGPVQLAEVFAMSGFFKDSRDSAKALVKILAGRELGLPPVVSMRGVSIVEGHIELKPALLASLLRNHGDYDYAVVESTDERCEVAITRGGTAIGAAEFTIQQAQKAGLIRGGSAWQKYPSDMLFARAMSRAVRRFAPDVGLASMYVEGEITNRDPDFIDVQVVEKPSNEAIHAQPEEEALEPGDIVEVIESPQPAQEAPEEAPTHDADGNPNDLPRPPKNGTEAVTVTKAEPTAKPPRKTRSDKGKPRKKKTRQQRSDKGKPRSRALPEGAEVDQEKADKIRRLLWPEKPEDVKRVEQIINDLINTADDEHVEGNTVRLLHRLSIERSGAKETLAKWQELGVKPAKGAKVTAEKARAFAMQMPEIERMKV